MAAVAVIGLSGCATTANNPQDPYEGFNRAMFKVNEGIDVVLKPVAEGYDAAAPLPVKTGVGNFFGNLADLWISFNGFLQGKGGQGASDFGRVLVNSTLGIAGLFDVASEMGMEKHAADFGQTLGKWGVDEGPFFYWPIIGPRTTRDTFGWVVDLAGDPVPYIDDVPVGEEQDSNLTYFAFAKSHKAEAAPAPTRVRRSLRRSFSHWPTAEPMPPPIWA